MSLIDEGHLRREVRTALELAVVTLAPTGIIDRLACAAGLLEALGELPRDAPPAVALAPGVVARSRVALEEWTTWRSKHQPAGPPSA